MPKACDITNQRFGKLIALSPAGTCTKNQGRLWKCICDCGNETVLTVGVLKSGGTKSCGCLSGTSWHKAAMTNFKHGEGHGRKTKEYRAWGSIKERCCHKGHPNYSAYGGRGIEICERWKNDYLAFLADMGRAREGQSIDRIDVDGDYEPSNCRWADAKTQQRNRRNTKYVTINGKKTKAMEVADLLGVSRNEIYIFIKILTLLENVNGCSP